MNSDSSKRPPTTARFHLSNPSIKVIKVINGPREKYITIATRKTILRVEFNRKIYCLENTLHHLIS